MTISAPMAHHLARECSADELPLFCALIFSQNCFGNSFESEAVIPCPRDDRGRVSGSAAGRQATGERDLFRSQLDRIIDLTHALVKLSRAIVAVFGGAVRIGLFRWPG